VTGKFIYSLFFFFFQYSVLISSLSKRAKSIVRDLDPTNELTYLRIKSRKHEVLVAPDDDYILIVVQNPPDPLPQ
jgi:dynein light chain roadblock-type